MSTIVKIYEELARSNFANGTLYIIGADNHIVELTMYAGFVVNAKCRGRTIEDIMGQLKIGDVKQIRLTVAEVKPEFIKPEILTRFLDLCAAEALRPSAMKPERMAVIISLIADLDASEIEANVQAAVGLVSYIERFYPNFSFERTPLQKRIQGLVTEHNVIIPGLHQDLVPMEAKRIPAWLVSVLSTIPSRRLRSFAQYYLLFGEAPQKMLGLTAKKDTSLGAKPGYVKLSKSQYAPYSNSAIVTLFSNLRNAGDFRIIWHSENKRELFITKADYERAGLGQNDTIVVLFH